MEIIDVDGVLVVNLDPFGKGGPGSGRYPAGSSGGSSGVSGGGSPKEVKGNIISSGEFLGKNAERVSPAATKAILDKAGIKTIPKDENTSSMAGAQAEGRIDAANEKLKANGYSHDVTYKSGNQIEYGLSKGKIKVVLIGSTSKASWANNTSVAVFSDK